MGDSSGFSLPFSLVPSEAVDGLYGVYVDQHGKTRKKRGSLLLHRILCVRCPYSPYSLHRNMESQVMSRVCAILHHHSPCDRGCRRPHSRHPDLEIGGTDTLVKSSEQVNLGVEMAGLVEKHPHYAELIAAIKRSNFTASPEHLELFARRCCGGKTKSQCWACEGVICDDCTVPSSDVPSPRTNHHITHCLAMCTTCYLLMASSQPAAFSATLNPTDLSRQYRGCRFEEKGRTMAGEISLCRSCGNLAPADIAAIREAREARRLALTLKRDILCGECEKPIPKHKRRWWIIMRRVGSRLPLGRPRGIEIDAKV